MNKYIKRIIILILIILLSFSSTSCGISSIFIALNDIASQVREDSNSEETDTSDIETSEETSETTVETTEETTTVAETTIGITNSENVEVQTSPAESVAQTQTVTDISNPQDYTEEQATAASTIVSSLNPSDAYSAVLTYHNWIVSHTVYTLDLNYNNADGVFSYGQSACLGYSLAFEALMDEWSSLHPEFGVECVVAYGDNDYPNSPDVGHAWNMVKIGGAWYHVDVTWDDAGSESLYFYFLLPTSIISQSRVTYFVDNFQAVPSANSTSYVFGPKLQGVNSTVVLQSITQFSEKYLEKLNSGNATVTFFYPKTENPENISITNEVYNKLHSLGYTKLYYSNYYDETDEYEDPPTYSNGTYNDYYFFTIYVQ